MKFFTENASLKFVSLIVSILLWFHVTTNIRTLELLIPYEIKGVPQNKILVSSYKDRIKVRLSGPSFILKSLQSSYPVFSVEVPAGLQQDRYTAKFSSADLGLPNAVQILSIEPKQVDLRFDARIWKEVPVEVPRIGALDPDYSLTALVVEPDRVKLEGPATELKELKQVETYPLPMKELVGNPQQILGLRLSSGLIEASVSSVKVQVDLAPIVVTKTFERVPISVKEIQGVAAKLDPGTVSVRISGPRKLLRNLTSDQIRASLSPPTSDGNFVLKPEIELSKDMVLLGTEPEAIEVLVRIEQKLETPTKAVKEQ